MKKIIALLLVVIMCLSFTACGNDAELEKYKKYDTLINYLEANDYASAIAEITLMQISGGGNGSTDGNDSNNQKVIEITLDNWQDYFEIVKREETKKNNFDEIEHMYITYYLVLKDEYKMPETNNSTKIDVEWNYIDEWRYFEIDKENGVLTIGELVPDGESVERNGNMTTIRQGEASLSVGHLLSDGMQTVPTNVEIVRIQGTLCIEE